jgi:hypothetical protein
MCTPCLRGLNRYGQILHPSHVVLTTASTPALTPDRLGAWLSPKRHDNLIPHLRGLKDCPREEARAVERKEQTTAQQWLLSRDGKNYGPMSSGQLRKLCQTGKINPADLICRVGSDRWMPASELRGLFPEATETTETVPEVTVRPVEEVSVSLSHAADARWKTFGSLFCIANLAVCGAWGLVKPPPDIVQTMASLKQETKRINDELKNIKLPNMPSIPTIPGVR